MNSRKKTIIICCASYPPEVGGAPGRIRNLAILLKDLGYAVTVITAMPNYPMGVIFPGYRGRIVCRENIEGIRVVRLALIPATGGNWLLRGASLFTHSISILLFASPRLLFGKADAVLVSSPPLITSFLYSWLAKLGRKKLLVNISDLWPLTATELGVLKEGLMMKSLRRIERYLYRNANGIMAQSEAILAHIREDARHKDLFLYRNLPIIGNTLENTQSIPSPRRIIYAGVLGFAQGILEICRNIDFRAENLELHIYGDGVEKAAIADYINNHPGSGIFLHPTVTPDKLDSVFNRYAAMLIPLKNEIRGAVPSKLFSAMAYSIPVLFCGGGEGERIVNDSNLGWTSKPGDVKALRQSVKAFSGATDAELSAIRENIALVVSHSFKKENQDKAFASYLDRIVK